MKYPMLIILVLGGLAFSACSGGADRVFSAADELHSIILYKEGQKFELLYNGFNTVEGTYVLRQDTIRLTYFEDQVEAFRPNDRLTRTIVIDQVRQRVHSVDKRLRFCADIHFDQRGS